MNMEQNMLYDFFKDGFIQFITIKAESIDRELARLINIENLICKQSL